MKSEPEVERKPTIENPFAKSTNRNTPFVAAQSIQKREAAPPEYNPGYYTSVVSKQYLTNQIDAQVITKDELPFIHELALLIGKVFMRPLPTISDFKYAVRFRTLDTVKKAASGEESIDIIIQHGKTQEVLNKNDRILLWQKVAKRVLEEYDKLHLPTI